MPISTDTPFQEWIRAAMYAAPTIPGYDFTHLLGGGPLTCVWAARDTERDELVAVKCARPDCDDPELAALLLEREARATFSLRHPHLIRLRRATLESPSPYLVMDLLPGESLRDRLRREYRLDSGLALSIARQTSEALAALHRNGFVHGDVKPENIRLIDSGTAVLIDLGFAHRPGENSDLLQRGLILGTANYLAPEECAQVAESDGRADMFSLGITLFEMLTGMLPYPLGTTAETLRSHRDTRPAKLQNHPPVLVEFLARLLAKRPVNRPHASQAARNLVGLEIALMLKSA